MKTSDDQDWVYLQGQIRQQGPHRDTLFCIRFESSLGTFSVVASLHVQKLLEVHLLNTHEGCDQPSKETWPSSDWKHAKIESLNSMSASKTNGFHIHKNTWCRTNLPLLAKASCPLSPTSSGSPHSKETELLKLFQSAVEQLRSYASGDRTIFDLPLQLSGTPFQNKVWQALLDIPYGQTCSYGELAKKIGKPQGARAVGGALNRNPLGIIVPCHRVVGASGELTGFAGGLDLKKRLLELERRAKIE